MGNALEMVDVVDQSLKKAKAIIWLMSNQSGSGIIDDDAMRWAGLAACEMVDNAISASSQYYKEVQAS